MLLGATAGGCGYRHGELYPEGVRTIAVPVFDNRSFYRGVEFELTEALVKQIELRTPYKVTGADAADTILLGTITGVSQRRTSRIRDGGVPQDMEVRVTVDFDWKNQRSGDTLTRRKGLVAAGRYIPTRPVGETLQTAEHDAVQRMTEQIIASMGADW